MSEHAPVPGGSAGAGSHDEMMEEAVYSSLKRGASGGMARSLFRRAEIPLILLGAVLVVLIVLFIVFRPASDTGKELETRFQQIEKRLTHVEALIAEIQNAAPKDTGDLSKLNERINRVEAAATMRMDHLSAQLAEASKAARKEARPAEKAAKPAVASPAKKPPVTKAQYHEVRKGETLYRISKQYGLSVDALLRLNGLGPKSVIHPGQKLKVGPKKAG
jgi:LysM repeat protein